MIVQDEGGNKKMNVWSMRNSGYELRKAILAAKGVVSDECIRGTIYRLTNALSVGNTERFMDVIIRLYTSSRLDGYAFVLGLKGSHHVSKEENENG